MNRNTLRTKREANCIENTNIDKTSNFMRLLLCLKYRIKQT